MSLIFQQRGVILPNETGVGNRFSVKRSPRPGDTLVDFGDGGSMPMKLYFKQLIDRVRELNGEPVYWTDESKYLTDDSVTLDGVTKDWAACPEEVCDFAQAARDIMYVIQNWEETTSRANKRRREEADAANAAPKAKARAMPGAAAGSGSSVAPPSGNVAGAEPVQRFAAVPVDEALERDLVRVIGTADITVDIRRPTNQRKTSPMILSTVWSGTQRIGRHRVPRRKNLSTTRSIATS